MSTVLRKALSVFASLVLAVSLVPAAALPTIAAPATAEAATAPTLTVTRVSTGKVTLKVKSSYKLGASATKGSKITYKSSKKSVAAVSSKGTVKARKAGKATITVKAKKSGRTTTRKVYVTVVRASKYKAVRKVYAKAGASAVVAGQTTKVSVTFNPKSPSNRNVTFKSSNASVATVSASGTVTAKKAGTVTITATSCYSAKRYARVRIYVKPSSDDAGSGSADDTPGSDTDDQGSTSDVPGVTAKSAVESYTWDELKAISNAIAAAGSDAAGLEIAKKYNLCSADGKLTGNETKALSLSDETQCTVQILGFRHDDKSDGGKAGIAFGFKEIVESRQMNSSSTNSGGWASSEMRTYLNGTFYDSLPSDVRSNITSISKMTNNTGKTTSTTSVTSTIDKVWLPSQIECYGSSWIDFVTSNWDNGSAYAAVCGAEGSQYKLYADNDVTKSSCSFLTKCPLGTSAGYMWWLRSPCANFSGHFFNVYYDGGWNIFGANLSYGVSPAFCF